MRIWWVLVVAGMLASLAGCDGKVAGHDAGLDAGEDASVDDGDAGAGDDGGAGGDDAGVDAGADDGGVDAGADDGGPVVSGCEPLPAPPGDAILVTQDQADQLRQIVLDAPAGAVIALADGRYEMDGGDNSHRLSFYRPDVTLRSQSGDPAAVVLDGGYVTGELLSISASRVTIAELTLTKAYNHPIHVTGASDHTIEGVRIYRVRVIDGAEQAIKINSSGEGTFTDFGEVACSHIELTDEGRTHVRNNCYTGGVDAHQAWGWVVRDNFITGFWCPQGLSEHGVHFWTTGRDTLVERNTIVDCARGIGFGLGENGNGNTRVYPDDPYPGAGYLGHIDGVIRNNFIAASSSDLFASGSGFDSGIGLEQAHGTLVAHNTVVSTQAPFSSIEWRWANTDVRLVANLVSHNLRDRGGDDTTEVLTDNLENAPAGWFEDIPAGDLHLTGAAAGAVDQGAPMTPGECDEDIDGQLRDATPDLGADER